MTQTLGPMSITRPINPDGSLGAWQASTFLPLVSGVAGHQIVVNGDHVYCIGGTNNTINTGAMAEVYYARINTDGTIGQWAVTTDLPKDMYFHRAFAWNGFVYCTGGYTGANSLDTVYYAPINPDSTLGTWQETTKLPRLTFQHQAFVRNGIAFVAGGVSADPTSIWYDDILWAEINTDGTLGSWQETFPLPYQCQGHQTLLYEDTIYHLGGKTGHPTWSAQVHYTSLSATAGFAPDSVLYDDFNDNDISNWTTGRLYDAEVDDIAPAAQNSLYVASTGSGGHHKALDPTVDGTAFMIRFDVRCEDNARCRKWSGSACGQHP